MHFKKISNFHVFCTQTYAKCRFWANFVPTCEYKTSRDLATDCPIFANLVSKDAQDLKEKSHENACRDLRRSRGSRGFRAGGVKLTPPPPVKIGLKVLVRVLACAKLQRERINCTSVYLVLYRESSVKISTQTDSY